MANLNRAVLALALGAVAFPQTPAATDAHIKFKDGDRYLRDLSVALNLPRESICKELSQYDCYTDAFRIVLGGMEPYGIRALEPIAEASLTSPIALDRVALRVCSARVAEDMKDTQKAVLYVAPPSKNREKNWEKTMVAKLYDKLLQREPLTEETARMMEFYSTVAAKHAGTPADAARDWVVLGCFSVASSLESVFY